MKRCKKHLIGAVFAILLAPAAAFSATFYISPTGSDTTGNGSQSNPWKTSVKAFLAGGGNTYIFLNGVYNYVDGNIVNPPSGTLAAPTVIRAQNDGAAIIDGGSSRTGISIGQGETRQHIIIEGFKVVNTGEIPAISIGSPDGTAIASQTNNITIRRTGAKAGIQAENDASWGLGSIRDSLFEDIWAWGEGRYTFIAYGCTNVTVRRAVFRWDGWGEGAEKPNDPQFNLGVYDTHDSLFENILLIDRATSTSTGDLGGLYVPGNDNGNTAPYTSSNNNRFFGLVILNNQGAGIGVEGGSGANNVGNSFTDIVVWANTEIGITVPKKAGNTSFNHVTVAKNPAGTYFATPGITFNNSLVWSNTGSGLSGVHSGDYNNVVANGNNYNGGASAGVHSISTNPQLKYVARIENGSPGDNNASDGGDRGANVIRRYVNGALTTENLWPWLYQDRIKADMCAGVTRGFCSSSSLTEYIWAYLGNANPYGNGPGVPPANPPPGNPPAGNPGNPPSNPVTPGNPSSSPVESTDRMKPKLKSIAPGVPNGGVLTFGDDALKVTVINPAGREVITLHKTGSARIVWNGRTSSGQIVESGYYMCRIEGVGGRTVHHVVAVAK